MLDMVGESNENASENVEDFAMELKANDAEPCRESPKLQVTLVSEIHLVDGELVNPVLDDSVLEKKPILTPEM